MKKQKPKGLSAGQEEQFTREEFEEIIGLAADLAEIEKLQDESRAKKLSLSELLTIGEQAGIDEKYLKMALAQKQARDEQSLCEDLPQDTNKNKQDISRGAKILGRALASPLFVMPLLGIIGGFLGFMPLSGIIGDAALAGLIFGGAMGLGLAVSRRMLKPQTMIAVKTLASAVGGFFGGSIAVFLVDEALYYNQVGPWFMLVAKGVPLGALYGAVLGTSIGLVDGLTKQLPNGFARLPFMAAGGGIGAGVILLCMSFLGSIALSSALILNILLGYMALGGSLGLGFKPSANGERFSLRGKTTCLWAFVAGVLLLFILFVLLPMNVVLLDKSSEDMRQVAVSPDGSILAGFGSDYAKVTLWNLPQGVSDKVFEIPVDSERQYKISVSAIRFSPDSKLLAVATYNNRFDGDWKYDDFTIYCWELQSGQIRSALTGHLGEIHSLSFTPDGKYLASASGGYGKDADNSVRIWDIAAGDAVEVLRRFSAQLRAALFSADGKSLITGEEDGTISIWNRMNWELMGSFSGESLRSIALAERQPWLAVVEGDNIRIWDLMKKKVIQNLRGHSSTVTSVSFSMNSDFLISGSWDETIRGWDLASGTQKKIFLGHSDRVGSVAFSPKGGFFVSSPYGWEEEPIRLWYWNP